MWYVLKTIVYVKDVRCKSVFKLNMKEHFRGDTSAYKGNAIRHWRHKLSQRCICAS